MLNAKVKLDEHVEGYLKTESERRRWIAVVASRLRAGSGRFDRRVCLVLLFAGLVACGGSLDDAAAPQLDPGPRQVSLDYVIRFLPRYYTHKMQALAGLLPVAVLSSPSEVTPVFRNIVQPNDDTFYAAALLDLSEEPVVLTVPDTELRLTVQVMDLLTEVLPNDIGGTGGGSHAFVGPGWNGTVPPGLRRVDLPVSGILMIVRVNRNLGDRDVSPEARALVASLTLRRLSEPRGHRTLLLPPVIFAQSNKLDIEREAGETPLVFLGNLREAVRDPLTPLTPSDIELLETFDRYFEEGSTADEYPPRQSVLDEMAAGVAEAFGRISRRHFYSNTTATGWLYFRETGRWGSRFLDRAAVSHYCLYANIESKAHYYMLYQDEGGLPLDGTGNAAYEIRFSPERVPRAGSFWSLTAYNNDAYSFIPNVGRQYNVPSYRQGLMCESDGSIVIRLHKRRPPPERVPNWLPIDLNPFHVVLRIYEPQVPYADYEPPPARPR